MHSQLTAADWDLLAVAQDAIDCDWCERIPAPEVKIAPPTIAQQRGIARSRPDLRSRHALQFRHGCHVVEMCLRGQKQLDVLNPEPEPAHARNDLRPGIGKAR